MPSFPGTPLQAELTKFLLLQITFPFGRQVLCTMQMEMGIFYHTRTVIMEKLKNIIK